MIYYKEVFLWDTAARHMPPNIVGKTRDPSRSKQGQAYPRTGSSVEETLANSVMNCSCAGASLSNIDEALPKQFFFIHKECVKKMTASGLFAQPFIEHLW